MMNKTFWMGFLCALSSVAGAANFAKTPQEEAMCQALIYNGRDTSDRENWMHMHHFCDCMRFTNRALAALGNKYDMKYNLQIAIGGCDYVLEHTKSDFYMRPEVHLQKGKALQLFGQEGRAAVEFVEAMRGNPRLAQAYVELADVQVRNKKAGDALKTVTEGLRHAPDSKPLQRRYTELGGKLPYPTPIMPGSASAPSAQPDGGAPPATAATAGAAPPDASESDTKIGSPTNPYCRFCPD